MTGGGPPAEPRAAERVRFAAADGTPLHGRLRLPTGRPRGAAVLTHPHPDFGGTMDVWLLPRLGEALAAAGWVVLRFDFRSVREGVDPDGAAAGHPRERDDIAGAIAMLRERGLLVPGRRLALAGWSFGALVALLHGLDEPAVTDWVGIAPATGPLPDLPMAEVPAARVRRWSARRVVVTGEHDQFFPLAAMAVFAPQRLQVVVGTDHFLFDRDDEVAALVSEALA